MFHIAICDDTSQSYRSLLDMSQEILSAWNIPCMIDTFLSGKELIAVMQKNPQRYEMIFLEIFIEGNQGMELAAAIRKLNAKVSIVFVTTSLVYTLDAYKVRAMRYLLKPVEREALADIFREMIRDYSSHNLLVRVAAEWEIVPLDDIVCMETQGRKVVLTLTDRTLDYMGKLSDLETRLLGTSFVRTHQSYIVNINHVRKLSRTAVITTSDKIIPVSRRYFHKVRSAFQQFFEVLPIQD